MKPKQKIIDQYIIEEDIQIMAHSKADGKWGNLPDNFLEMSDEEQNAFLLEGYATRGMLLDGATEALNVYGYVIIFLMAYLFYVTFRTMF